MGRTEIMNVKTEDRATTKIINYVRENKLTCFFVTDFAELGLTPRQAKSSLECLVTSGRLFHHGLEGSNRRARVIYSTSKKPSKQIIAELKRAKTIDQTMNNPKDLQGWREVFPEMFNPVVIKGKATVYKKAMV